jgi:hypothetical protein
MAEAQLVTPQEIAEKAEREAQLVLTAAKSLVIVSDDDYRMAGREFVAIKNMIKDLEAQRVAITKPMDAAKAAVMDLFRRPKEAFEAALALREKPMVAYQREVEEKRKKAEAEARAETERLQREARLREQEERDRLEQIRKDAEEAQRRASSASSPLAAFLAKKEAAELTQAADQQVQVVTDSIREAVTVQAVVDYIPKATAAGTSARTNWKFRITDPDLIPRQWLVPDEREIGAYVRMHKDKAVIPGIEIYNDITIGGR